MEKSSLYTNLRICIEEQCFRRVKDKHTRCRQCRYKREKELDLVGWSYRTQKANAKRRGHDFDLTLEEFKRFAYRTNLITKDGIKNSSYTVDRIRNWEGYHKDNIQVLTPEQNSRKGDRVMYWDEESRCVKIMQKLKTDEEDYPF